MAREGMRELARVPIFSELSPRQLRRVLRSTEEYRYRDGSEFVREGARSEQLFVILEGRARVRRRGRTVARLGPGDFFGEISLLDGGPRSADVVADTDVTMLGLTAWVFRGVLEQYPSIAQKMLVSMAGRLRGAKPTPND
jgi:CRP-like cAMP-binding protein